MTVITNSKDIINKQVVYNYNTNISITYQPAADTKSSLTSKITKKYTKTGLMVLKKLASKFRLKLKTVYNQFIKYGVTKAQLKKVASGLLKMIKRGADFCVCSTTAVSKYLGIGKYFTAVQQIAAEISLNLFETNKKGHYIPTSWSAQAKVLSKNGVKNAEGYNVRLSDLISMKKGTKILVNAYCYNKRGRQTGTHAITIVRQKDGKYGVYDILVNGGNKVIYTQAQFKRLMNGQSATGRTTSGRRITKSKYLNSAEGYLRYKFTNSSGAVYVVGNSSKIIGSDTRTKYNRSISIINSFLKRTNLNSVVKTWLIKAKALVVNVFKSSKKDSIKYSSLYGATFWLEQIKSKGLSLISIIKTQYLSSVFPIFSSLNSVLKDNITYKIYTRYGLTGVNQISEYSQQYGVSATTIYNKFVESGV